MPPGSLDTRRSEGHYGNTITTVSASLRKGEASGTLDRLREALPHSDLDYIRETLPSRTDGSTLYLRLDKQEMVSGRVRLSDSGTVRVRVTAPAYGGRPEETLARLLGLD
jgi:RNA binding exosome subunit